MNRFFLSMGLATGLLACQGGGDDLDAGPVEPLAGEGGQGGVGGEGAGGRGGAGGVGGEGGDGSGGEGGIGGEGGMGAGGDGGAGGAGGGAGGEGGMPGPAADSMLRFEPRFGTNVGREFPGGWAVPFEDGPLVVMLCATDDPECEAPALVREITADETDGDPVMGGFGPQVSAMLPAGDYLLMVMIDSPTSRALGLGWQDEFFTRESAWGGVVSEWDLLMTETGAMAAPFEHLPPTPVAITLSADAATDLGVIELKHFHERDHMPVLAAEDGHMVVATPSGLRLVDTQTQRPIEVVEGSGIYEFTLVDDTGDALGGELCGLVQGSGSTVYALFVSGAPDEAGYAVPFDVDTRTQGDYRVRFPNPGGAEAQPCRGVFHAADGHEYLFVTNAPASQISDAGEGLWYAELGGLGAADVAAGVMTRADDLLYQVGVNTLTAAEDRLYLSVSPSAEDRERAPAESIGYHGIFVATFDANTGEPSLSDPELGEPNAGESYTYWRGPAAGAGYRTRAGDVPCVAGYGYAGIAVADFHDGRTLVFLGGCAEVSVFDAASGEQLDYNTDALPGRPGIDATQFGQAFTSFGVSPDGTTLYALPQQKSPLQFFIERGTSGNRQTYNRMMLLPIDLTAGHMPALAARFEGENIDGHEGATSLSPLNTPAADPGIDLNYANAVRYQLQFLPDSAGSSFQSASFPIGHSMAVTDGGIWLRGSGAPGSGLGKGGDLAVYDLQSAQAVFFAQDGYDFYQFWLNGVAGDSQARFGFDLTPGQSRDVTTRGLAFVP